MLFLLPENLILLFRRKMKDGLSQKMHKSMIFSENGIPKIKKMERKQHWKMIFLVLSGKMIFLIRKLDLIL